jgi:hypothetical protein
MTTASVFGTWHARCDVSVSKHSVPTTFRMYPITSAFEKEPEKVQAIGLATGAKFALVRPCVTLRPISADKAVEDSFADSLRQPAPSLGTVTVALIAKSSSKVYTMLQPAFSSVSVRDVEVEGVGENSVEALKTYCWKGRPVIPADFRNGEMIFIPDNLLSVACFGEVDGRHRTSQAASRNDAFIAENWNKGGDNMQISELAYVHCQVMIAPAPIFKEIEDSVSGCLMENSLRKLGAHLRPYSSWLNFATNATVVDSPLSLLLSLVHRASEISRGNGRLSTPCVVKIDGMDSDTQNASKGGPVERQFAKTEVCDVRYISVNTSFGGENGTAMARAIFETVTGWIRGAVRLNGCVFEHRCRFCMKDEDLVAGGVAVTRGITALMPESGWDGELADLMVPFSTMRRCLQIVKVVTAAAYRVDKVAELFSTGGSRAMWARLRRAEISLITRDMASVVMSIAAVRLAPDAKTPIPLPAIAKALNIPIQSTSEQESRASPVTLIMIGSAAAALVLADVASVLGLKSPSALLQPDELCEGEKYVGVSQEKDALEEFAQRFMTSCSGVVVEKARKKDGPPLLFANKVHRNLPAAVRTHSKEGIMLLQRALPDLRVLLTSVVSGEHDEKIEEDVAKCGVLAGKRMQPERREDFASWLCGKVIGILDQAGNDGNRGLGVNKNLVERLRVWVLEIRRGNGPLVAPMFAVERDEKLIEESKCYGNHVEPYAHNDEESVEGESEEESEDIYVAGTNEAEARNDAPNNHPKVGGKTVLGKRPATPATYQKRRVARGKRHVADDHRAQVAQDEAKEFPDFKKGAEVPQKMQTYGKSLYDAVIDLDVDDDEFFKSFQEADRSRAKEILKELRGIMEKNAGGEASISLSDSISIGSEDGGDVHGSSDDDEDDGGSMAREAVPQPITQTTLQPMI